MTDYLQKCRDGLIPFARSVYPGFQDYWHIKKLAEILEKVEAGNLDRVMIQFPPRHGKSLFTSQIFPAWFAGRNPDKKVILVAGTHDLASEFGYNCRNILQDPAYNLIFPDSQVRQDSRSRTRFHFGKKGYAFFMGREGQITGRGANLFVIDDLTKSAADADSDAGKKEVRQWYKQNAYNRLEKGGRIIIIGCLTGDTLITMSDGSYKPFQDIKIGDNVLSWKSGQTVIRPVLNMINQGPDEIYEVKTGHHTIKGNAKHPLLVEEDGHYKWKQISNLVKGDKLVVNRSIPAQQTAKISIDEAWLLGFMFGDGWVTTRKGNRKKYSITCVAISKDLELNAYISSLFKTIFDVVLKHTNYGYDKTEYSFVGRWFKDMGLNGTAKTKRIPYWIYSQPVFIRKAFLSGFVAADGHIVKKHNQAKVELANLDLIKDIRHLARGIGYKTSNISSRTRMSQPPHSPKPFQSYSYHVQWKQVRTVETFQTSTIRTIKQLPAEDVYDMQVEETENFIADGIVSHNTRWREDDIQGWLLDKEEQERIDSWTVFRFPAIAEEDEEFRKIGDALCPDLVPLEMLQRAEEEDRRSFAGIFQQRPSIEQGNIIQRKWLHVEKLDHTLLKPPRILSLDTAYKEGAENDYSAATIGQRYDLRHLACLFADQKKLDLPKLITWVLYLIKEWQIQGILIEDAASGQSLIQTIRKLTPVPVIPMKIQRGMDKISRVHAVTPFLESGGVLFDKWVPASTQEILFNNLLSFPQGKNDDLTDSFTHLITYLLRYYQSMRKLTGSGKSSVLASIYDR